jgi:hypothetical protein
LPVSGSFELAFCEQFFFKMIFSNMPMNYRHIGIPFYNAIDAVVMKKEPYHQGELQDSSATSCAGLKNL